MTDQTDAELIAEARGHAEDAEAGRTTGNALLYRALSDRLRALIRLSGELEAVRLERDNWKLSAEVATRAEKRWKDRAVKAERENRQHQKDLAEWEKVHAPAWIDARDRQIAEARAQRDQLAAVIEKVRVRLTTDLDVNDESHVSDALDILATSPADILREVKAAVWDEGVNAEARAAVTTSPRIKNPYRVPGEQS